MSEDDAKGCPDNEIIDMGAVYPAFGSAGKPQLYSVDVSGRNLLRIPTPDGASDPAWSPLLGPPATGGVGLGGGASGQY